MMVNAASSGVGAMVEGLCSPAKFEPRWTGAAVADEAAT
jgi:hypothetical protein